jgi:4-carboxymuconolactone decarboxylase
MRHRLRVSALLLVSAFALPIKAADGPIARVPAVTEASQDPYVKEMFAAVHARGGEPINLQLVMALAPTLAKAHQEVAYAIRFDLETPREYRELTILRTVQNWEGAYEFNQHTPMARACGYSQAQIDGLAHWREGKLFDETQRAVLAYVDELTTRPGRVDEATYAALAAHFKPNEIVELTLTAGSYMGTAAFTNAIQLKTETDGRQAPIGKC